MIKKIERDSSIEILRLFLMFLIIIGHCIIHGLGLYGVSPNSSVEIIASPNDILPITVIYNFCTCAVNCFILISGYFGIKLSKRKIIALLFALIFYDVIFNVLPALLQRDYHDAVVSLFFLSHSPYWFIIDYLFLMIFAPLLNNCFSKMSEIYENIVVISMLIASCYFGFLWSHPVNVNGYTLFQFFTMYCVGRIIKKRNINIKIWISFLVYILGGFILGYTMYECYIYKLQSFTWRICYYNNPIVMINAIALFFIFREINIGSSIINNIAKSTLAIYLVQSSWSVSGIMYDWIKNLYFNGIVGWRIVTFIIVLSFSVIIVSLLIDQLRLNLERHFVSRFKENRID